VTRAWKGEERSREEEERKTRRRRKRGEGKERVGEEERREGRQRHGRGSRGTGVVGSKIYSAIETEQSQGTNERRNEATGGLFAGPLTTREGGI